MAAGHFRFFLALVVLIHHSFPFRLGAWAVGIFFILSGYWIARMWEVKYSQLARPYRMFLAGRWFRLAPLFLFAQLLAAALVSTNLIEGNQELLTAPAWWGTQLSILGSTWFGRILPPSWSLDVEMQFYMVAPLILFLIAKAGGWRAKSEGRRAEGEEQRVEREEKGEKSSWFLVLGSWFLVRGAWLGLLLGVIGWSVWRLQQGATLETASLDIYLWLFLIGILANEWNWKPSGKVAIRSIIVFCCLIAIVFVSPLTRSLIWMRGADPHAVSGAMTAWFLVISVLVAAPVAIYSVHQPSSAWDRWLGDLSYPLYLFHWIPRDWYYSHVDWSRGWLWNSGLLAANFAIAIVGAILLLQFVDRPIQRKRKSEEQRAEG